MRARTHARVHRSTYRALPVKRRFIPKPGSSKQRPLGIAALEHKIVQRVTVEVLSAIYEEDCEWLRLGAAIEKVEINTVQHDRSGCMCNDYGYGEAQDLLLRQFVEEFSVFSMIWGTLEAALDIMKLPQHSDKSQRGKISDVGFHLSHHLNP